MSAEDATAFFERMTSDDEFRARVEAAPTADEKRTIVTEAGYDLSADDLPTIRALAGIDELSDEALEGIAAGMTLTTAIGIGGGVVVVTGAAALAAAAIV